MQLQEILYTQGFGTRRVCAGLIQQGHVQVYPSNPGLAPETIAQAATEFVANIALTPMVPSGLMVYAVVALCTVYCFFYCFYCDLKLRL